MTEGVGIQDNDFFAVGDMTREEEISVAINIARLQEHSRHQDHRQDLVENTLTEHMKKQSETNEKLYDVAYESLHEIKNAKYWVSGALAAVGLMWLLVTHLDDLKKLFT